MSTSTSRPGHATPAPGLAVVHYRDIVGASGRMQRIFRLVRKVARTDSTVLLVGESGTGKELIARTLHLQSRRAAGPFVPVNVGALPESLIESELFGHVRGAFTGASDDRPGLIEAADQGTLFLDEIGDMPLATQVKLLRTLEESEVRRVGGNATRMVDIRVIAATHRDLSREVAAGRFREDLFYRLNVVQIELPPLRERREDIGLLASYFLERASARAGRPGLAFLPEAMLRIERHDYPGNVRELENAIEHAVAVAEGTVIGVADLPAAIRSPRLLAEGSSEAIGDGARGAEHASSGGDETGEVAGAGPRGDPRQGWSLADVEREHIRRVLARHRGNATVAARQLGISRTTLWRKLREYGLRRTGS
ncbi:MAG: sigma-54 interaction domain-containing protein [Candidatus Eiseniibacteriota bacterium]